MANAAGEAAPRSATSLALLMVLLAALFAAFVSLGTWQVHRRAWKLDLIQRVEQRLHADAVAAPGRDAWPRIGADDEYRKVRVDGALLRDHTVFVKAVTERGAGFWVLTPLQTRDGFIVLINRGFVEGAAVDRQQSSSGEISVSGLLRLSEPNGGFLRHNDPIAQRWFSRDVAAIAAAQKLPAENVAPYFIDADSAANPGNDASPGPIGGMTVVSFHNGHLVYLLTWYGLAAMTAGGMFLLLRSRRT
jgi:surfeit locus 1 family protein